MTDTSNPIERPVIIGVKRVRIIAGKTLDQWRELASRDDCLEWMNPSELQQLVAAIPDTGENK